MSEAKVPAPIPEAQAPSPFDASVMPPATAQMGWVPTAPILDKRSYASAMSYVGSTRRVLAWCRAHSSENTATNIVMWVLASAAVVGMWMVVTAWYFVAFVLFGIFMIPWRLIRRSQRKSHHMQQAQLATMQAMMLQQQTQQSR